MKIVKIKPFEQLSTEVKQGIIPDHISENNLGLPTYYGISASHIDKIASESREIYIDEMDRLYYFDTDRLVDGFVYSPIMYTVVKGI